jgi:hypothetical protein
MGNSSSSTSLSEVMSDYNANLTTLMNNVAAKSSTSCTANNSVSIKAKALIGPCNMNVAETATVVCNMADTFTSSNSSDLTTLMQNAANQTASAASTSLQGALAIGGSSSNTNISVQQAIQNVIKTDVTNNISNTCMAQGTVNNDFSIDIDGTIDCTGDTGAWLNLVQGGQLTVTSTCITDAITSAIEATATYNSSSQAATGTSSATNESPVDALFNGISNVVGSLGSLLSTPALIVLGVVAVVCLLAVGFKLLVHSSSVGSVVGGGYASPPPSGYGGGYASPAPSGYGGGYASPAPSGYASPAPSGYASPAPRGYGAPPPSGYGAPAPPTMGGTTGAPSISLQQIGSAAKTLAPQLEKLGPQFAKAGSVAATFA